MDIFQDLHFLNYVRIDYNKVVMMMKRQRGKDSELPLSKKAKPCKREYTFEKRKEYWRPYGGCQKGRSSRSRDASLR